ncbi:abc transporter b family [Holotrichia oblita]|nr:abc transporter b family [Holotrichia oblita]
MIFNPLDFFAFLPSGIAWVVDSASRIFEVGEAVSDCEPPLNPVTIEDFRGEIKIDNVSFNYDMQRPIIKNLSLDIKAGQMLGIAGKSGAGKTTLINLMARLYDAKSGAIYIDGVNVKDIDPQILRKNIGIVSQESYLFIGSIADNIRYADKKATMEQVIAAAKAANAHDFIMRMPDGYETLVGEGGQDLSGGEKQRVSIARAILQNPKILILDEATAAMDTKTERSIQKSLDSLKAGRTTIAIAHRLSTLRDADVLAVIENGELKEYGTHNELLKKQGVYFELFKIQAEALKFMAVGAEGGGGGGGKGGRKR